MKILILMLAMTMATVHANAAISETSTECSQKAVGTLIPNVIQDKYASLMTDQGRVFTTKPKAFSVRAADGTKK